MAVIKCKMCGGDLVIEPGATVAECEYCGTRQTIPNQDDEKKLTLFARANRLRMGCEFDKAAGIYESIVADFPQEAEAYWGLVLCKYGIEYVDDPATGKKIPTCHRSSFESIMEDSDFEQALENADVVARRVYREEAKQIEEIREGIIEVSGKEEPYDIFICYKETDENGQRTVDSVIAQDVYDALTEKGYRVFFSRITLEDKLGQEYEPYIFAALNSAKIMLAFGTDYEYYNAVWVKNEWSRYLKLMARDKSKHLIPCYKGIDAYDMPKEFAKLQAQDMGKVGAIQDLLRGIEKLLPRTDPSAPVQQVVQQVVAPADNRQSAQLDRGYMALEDGDWKKADGFFEEALNLDAHSAPAYIGKTLAQEQCRNLHALVLKKLSECQEVEAEKRNIQPEESQLSHIKEAVQKYSIPGYFEPPKVKALYEYDFSYPSYVSGRERQLEDQKQWWDSHRFLSRAEQFAAGDTAKELQAEKKFLLDSLVQRVEEAKKQEKDAIESAKQNYANFLIEADRRAEEGRLSGTKERENDYQELCAKAKGESKSYQFERFAFQFERLGDYRESKAMADFCRKRAKEEEAAENNQQKRAARRKKAAWIALGVLLLVTVGYMAANAQNKEKEDYASAGEINTPLSTNANSIQTVLGNATSEDLENPVDAVMTHAEYIAAELDSDVCIETYVQAHQSWWDGKITVYAQSEDGAYFIYNMACTEEDEKNLVPGTKIRVKGVKSEWAGEIEIVDATFEIVKGSSFIAAPTDVTALLGKAELIDHQNEYVTIKGLTVEKVVYKNDEPGDDIWITFSRDGLTLDYAIEAYLTGPDSQVYSDVSELKNGDVVDIEGFLYWYSGANTHITKVTQR